MTSADSCAVERGLVVGFCGQRHYCNRPYCPTAGFRSPSLYVVSVEPFLDRSRPMSCKPAKMGCCSITFLCDCGQRHTMNHIVDTCPSTVFEGGLNLLHKVDNDAVICLQSTAPVKWIVLKDLLHYKCTALILHGVIATAVAGCLVGVVTFKNHGAL